MRVDLCKVFKQLMPRLDLETDGCDELFQALTEEMQRVETKAFSVAGSIPESGGLLDLRWEDALGSKTPVITLASKGYYNQSHDAVVSNTSEHYQSIIERLAPSVTFSAGQDSLTFHGLRNLRYPMKCNRAAGSRLAHFQRDETFISTIEKIKHAHIATTYKESSNA